MDTQQLLDALTAHLALYHRHAISARQSNPSSTPRSAVLRWFSSLPSAAHRQSALTVVDPDFLRLLLGMLNRLRTHGHGFFFLLPDLPSSSSLPSLCFRRSHGLLSRSAAADPANQAIARSLLLFSSRDGEADGSLDQCSLDSVTVSEDFVADMDRFVEVMDGISGGRFLRGDESRLAGPWPELPWLKDKGYYSLEDFVANRLEVALRLSWLSGCHGSGKKSKGSKAMKEKAGVAGVAANAFWRKKGCVDWWAGLDAGGKRKILQAFSGKSVKHLVLVLLRCLFSL